MVAPAEILPLPFQQKTVSPTDLQQSGLPFEETTYLAIGGGLGSFIWVDTLLIHGANPAQVAVIGFEARPYGRFRRLCRNSQIPDEERLRSDSGGTPDNIWGWPGYAVREIWHDATRGQWRHAAGLAWQIFTEPVLTDPFTPKAGQVFKAIDREAHRIDWANLWRFGRVRAIRKTDGEVAGVKGHGGGCQLAALVDQLFGADCLAGVRPKNMQVAIFPEPPPDNVVFVNMKPAGQVGRRIGHRLGLLQRGRGEERQDLQEQKNADQKNGDDRADTANGDDARRDAIRKLDGPSRF